MLIQLEKINNKPALIYIICLFFFCLDYEDMNRGELLQKISSLEQV